MSIASRIKALFYRQDDTTQVMRVWQSPMTTAGVNITGDTVLRNATAWACIGYLSRSVAQLPWRVMQDMGEDEAPRRVPTHPVTGLLSRRPNPEMTAFSWRETMVGWAVRYGNAVAEIVRDNRGVPVAMWPQHPSRVTFVRNDVGDLVFNVRDNDGNLRELSSSQVFHLRGFGEGSVGLDVVSYAAESLGWSQATELFGASFFGNGARPSGFLTLPRRLSTDAKDALDAELKDRYSGPRKGNKVMILDGDIKFESASTQPNDAQFIETRQHQVEEVCRWFGVPPHKVMHLLRSTFSNIEHQSIEVVVDSITPWAIRFEQEADYKLFGANRQWFFTKLDMKGLLRGDFKSRQEGLQLMRRNGVINANEWRRLEDMDEIGPDGDKYAIEANMTTLEQLGAAAPSKPAPAAGDATSQAGDSGDAGEAGDATSSDGGAGAGPADAVTRARRQVKRTFPLH